MSASLSFISADDDYVIEKNHSSSTLDTAASVEDKHDTLLLRLQLPTTAPVLLNLNIIGLFRDKVKSIKRWPSLLQHCEDDGRNNLINNDVNSSNKHKETIIVNHQENRNNAQPATVATNFSSNDSISQKVKSDADHDLNDRYNNSITKRKSLRSLSSLQMTPTTTVTTSTSPIVEVSAYNDLNTSLLKNTIGASEVADQQKNSPISQCAGSHFHSTESSSSASSSILSTSVLSFRSRATKRLRVFSCRFGRRKKEWSGSTLKSQEADTEHQPGDNGNYNLFIVDNNKCRLEKNDMLKIRKDILAFNIPKTWASAQYRRQQRHKNSAEGSVRKIISSYDSASEVVDHINTLLEQVDSLYKQIYQNKLSIHEYKTKLRDMDDALLDLMDLTQARKGDNQYLNRLLLEIDQRQLLKQKHMEHKNLYARNEILKDMATDRLDHLHLKIHFLHENELKRRRWLLLHPFVAFLGILVAIFGFCRMNE